MLPIPEVIRIFPLLLKGQLVLAAAVLSDMAGLLCTVVVFTSINVVAHRSIGLILLGSRDDLRGLDVVLESIRNHDLSLQIGELGCCMFTLSWFVF